MSKKAKAIMLQGTASNVGKSLLTAGLCRIFRQDGYSVAPFKSQNMSLNSFITDEGLEMGRAQVMQAEAAGVSPSVRMNPILLKPTNDMGSQVIVNGISRGNMPAKDYFAYKAALRNEVLSAYNSLAAEHDIIVIEGAGSPAEINLKQNDIVNMGMAQMAGAPVLLVGDIDRGGVFASLYGTIKLLDPAEQDIIKGIIINKFRGDVNILSPGFPQLEELTAKPVLGVVPMLDIDVDEEDSLADRLTHTASKAEVDIAVIRLPRISNFTDFISLERVGGVGVRYVGRIDELGNPDLIILPGTKNTLDDLRWLKRSGLFSAIADYALQGGALIGICGGYQMLGHYLSDPDGVEGGGGEVGLCLLPMTTVFTSDKVRTRVSGTFTSSSGIFAELKDESFDGGYEIHMGITTIFREAPPLLALTNQDGGAKTDGLFLGNIFGSYVHGLFDDTAAAVVNCLRRSKGLPPISAPLSASVYKQQQYDCLATSLRQALDMPAIYRILERGI